MKSQRAYIRHVIECIGRIAEDSAPGRDAVFASRTLQDAIVRNLQVLCESTQRIGEPHRERHPEIDWTSIVGMRNVLVHDYFEVDFETVWDVAAAWKPAKVYLQLEGNHGRGTPCRCHRLTHAAGTTVRQTVHRFPEGKGTVVFIAVSSGG